MVTLPVEEGAVNSPLEVIVPALADQVTVVPVLLLLLALHCDVVLGAMMAGVHETVTLPLVLGGAPTVVAVFEDPHAVRKTAQADARKNAVN